MIYQKRFIISMSILIIISLLGMHYSKRYTSLGNKTRFLIIPKRQPQKLTQLSLFTKFALGLHFGMIETVRAETVPVVIVYADDNIETLEDFRKHYSTKLLENAYIIKKEGSLKAL